MNDFQAAFAINKIMFTRDKIKRAGLIAQFEASTNIKITIENDKLTMETPSGLYVTLKHPLSKNVATKE